MNIGFDLDKVFINHPPFVPASLMQILYGEKYDGKLSYRFPSRLEQLIRKWSHKPIFRTPIKKNIDFMRKLKKFTPHKFFLISSRYSFLKDETNLIIKKYQLGDIFTHMYFNFDDKQPHLFKEEIIKNKNIGAYLDDDLPLLNYLSNSLPKVKFFWLSRKNKQLKKNFQEINHLEKIFEYL